MWQFSDPMLITHVPLTKKEAEEVPRAMLWGQQAQPSPILLGQ